MTFPVINILLHVELREAFELLCCPGGCRRAVCPQPAPAGAEGRGVCLSTTARLRLHKLPCTPQPQTAITTRWRMESACC